MKLRKLTASLCAVAVMFASAGGLPLGRAGLLNTAITASAAPNPTFTVTIPAKVSLGDTAVVSIDSMENIPNGKYVCVTIAGDADGKFTVSQSDDKLTYTISGTRRIMLNQEDTTSVEVKNNTELLKSGGPSDTEAPREITLTFNEPPTSAVAAAKYAGKYKGTVTFNIAVS